MHIRQKRIASLFLLAAASIFILGCGLISGLEIGGEPTPTHTPGVEPPGGSETPCKGLSGHLALQLLVGPSEAVGLEPFTLADIPFAVSGQPGGYTVSGSGPVEYYQDILEAEWGSFTVTFAGETTVSGTCTNQPVPGTLDLAIEMDGEQTVVVTVDGMETTYPWTGTPALDVTLPIRDGAESGGEGWAVILHLGE